MMLFEKILVPVDLSPSCAWAAQYSAQLARRFGSELTLLHIGKPSPDAVESFLAGACMDAPHNIILQTGEPGEAIVRFVRDASPSLVVMPTHAHGKFRRYLLGSVTAKVLHDLDCPVLTGVHLEAVPAIARAAIVTIVCGVDSGAGFAPVLRKAIDVATLFGATLTTVHAIPAADETSDNRGEIEVRKYLFKLAEERFAHLKSEAGIDTAIGLAGGEVSTVIREAALRTGAQLAVIGRGQTQRELGRLRTKAYTIIRNSPCPVLSV